MYHPCLNILLPGFDVEKEKTKIYVFLPIDLSNITYKAQQEIVGHGLLCRSPWLSDLIQQGDKPYMVSPWIH